MTIEQTLNELKRKTAIIEICARENKAGRTVNGMKVAREYARLTGETMDWHYASDYLDVLRGKGLLKIDRIEGMTEYKLAA